MRSVRVSSQMMSFEKHATECEDIAVKADQYFALAAQYQRREQIMLIESEISRFVVEIYPHI